MEKKCFSLNDVKVISDNDNLSENDLSDIIGGISSSSASGCESCNCWWGNENKEKTKEQTKELSSNSNLLF
ncbi:hypothetical protein LJC72_08125 [Bacteroides sp. OttesenSCG-928-D19]|nr:hypothetical protein [Bacteroides sp. OttesenSCG-928-N06]MDL2305292.1 hypothetical protein [Bacteroides sp. OttesenSCG-928-D19]